MRAKSELQHMIRVQPVQSLTVPTTTIWPRSYLSRALEEKKTALGSLKRKATTASSIDGTTPSRKSTPREGTSVFLLRESS